MEENVLKENNKILKEILLILKLQNEKMLEKRIGEVATTIERKIMWAMFDGNKKIKDIAHKTNKDERTVQLFVKELETHNLIEPIRSMPRRKIDFIPASWFKLKVEQNGDKRKTE